MKRILKTIKKKKGEEIPGCRLPGEFGIDCSLLVIHFSLATVRCTTEKE
jgi:hypothetical protein